jgi:dolichol-phosphate mannosyltransferase
MNRLSILVPVYYNEGSLEALYDRFLQLEKKLDGQAEIEIVFVDDGSRDNSRKILRDLAEKDPVRIRLIFLSRNFGSTNAILAGLHYTTGDCVAIISADLQDPPEIIEDMYLKWLRGDQTVMAVREKREDPFLDRLFSRFSYAVFRKLALKDFPKGGFDFVLIDKRIRDIIIDINERNTNLWGLIVWIGFRQSEIFYTRKARVHGSSRWTFWKKFKYFIDSILAFSYAPMRFMSASGFILALLGIAYAALIVILRLINDVAVPGWTTLMVIVLVLFGFQFVFMGIIGEYIWRTLDETRMRPSFIISEKINVESNTE